jgi:hypothetical protein
LHAHAAEPPGTIAATTRTHAILRINLPMSIVSRK